MTIIQEEKNKSKLGTKSKILVLGIIFVAFIGLFGPTSSVNAEVYPNGCTGENIPAGCTPAGLGNCQTATKNTDGSPGPIIPSQTYSGNCTAPGQSWSGGAIIPQGPPPPAAQSGEKNQLLAHIKNCTSFPLADFDGCIEKLFFYIFNGIPSFLLNVVAKFFDAILAMTLSSTLFSSSDFISKGWGVVRDFSNLFFILALLYIAIKIILGIDTSNAKKMIAKVIITALLINFSMFFTQVVIDTSNVLALIFYNKLSVTDKQGRPIESLPTTNQNLEPALVNEKSISSGMAAAFDPSQTLSESFFKKAEQELAVVPVTAVGLGAAVITPIPGLLPIYLGYKLWGYYVPGKEVPITTILAIIFISGAIMLFATYAFAWASIAFISRLIELWILIIFSPFAFVSFAVPILNEVPYIGWGDWSKRLLKTAFMAPIFMFFMYLIFMLIHADLFGVKKISGKTPDEVGLIGTLVIMILSAGVILILLLKATEFAKKGSGVIGEKLMMGMKMAGGLALAAATGGTAMLATGTLGTLASKAASSEFLNKNQKDTGYKGILSRMALKTANYGTKASYDFRKLPGMGSLAKATGINMEAGKGIGLGIKEGGYEQRRKDKEDKEIKRAKEFEVKENEPLKQKLNGAEADLQKMLNEVAKDFERIDKDLISQRQKKADAVVGSDEEKKAVAEIKKLNEEKALIRDGTRVKGGDNDGWSISEMEKKIIPNAKNDLVKENRARQWAAADRLEKKSFWGNTNSATAHKIRMNAKVEEKAH